jgi:hypothetical protein
LRGTRGTSCRRRTCGNGRCCCTSRRPCRSRPMPTSRAR